MQLISYYIMIAPGWQELSTCGWAISGDKVNDPALPQTNSGEVIFFGQDVPGDGNCLYHSIIASGIACIPSNCCNGTAESHKVLRQITVEACFADLQFARAAYRWAKGEDNLYALSFEAYTKKMEDDGFWASDFEIYLL